MSAIRSASFLEMNLSKTPLSVAKTPLSVILVFVGMGTCSVTMTLLNKSLASEFPYPISSVLIQNIGSGICGAFLAFSGLSPVKPFRRNHLVPALINAALFVAILCSSLLALRYCSVVMYVVTSNARPLGTAIVEYLMSVWRLGANQSPRSVHQTGLIPPGASISGMHSTRTYSLALIVSGALVSVSRNGETFSVAIALCLAFLGLALWTRPMTQRSLARTAPIVALVTLAFLYGAAHFSEVRAIYSYSEESSKEARSVLLGAALGLLNVMLVACCTVYENRALAGFIKNGEQTSMGLSLYRVVISLPLLAVTAAFWEVPSIGHVSPRGISLLLITSFIGLMFGVTVYLAQAKSTATTIQVSNMLFKFLTSLLSMYTHPEKVGVGVVLAYAFSTSGFVLYSFR